MIGKANAVPCKNETILYSIPEATVIGWLNSIDPALKLDGFGVTGVETYGGAVDFKITRNGTEL